MKRILILVALGLFLCTTASAFQGGGGEATKKKAAPKKKTSGTTSANTKPATINLSNRTIITILERGWNYYLREAMFLGPTYFGNTTTFGKHRGSLHALQLMSLLPMYRALATKGLIKLDELSLSDAPSFVFSDGARVERAATVSLTEAGAKLGIVDNKANTVTFVLGTYRIEKIVSNTAVDTNEVNYRLIQGTHMLDIAQEFDDVWAELGLAHVPRATLPGDLQIRHPRGASRRRIARAGRRPRVAGGSRKQWQVHGSGHGTSKWGFYISERSADARPT